jgi:hypothetical protein
MNVAVLIVSSLLFNHRSPVLAHEVNVRAIRGQVAQHVSQIILSKHSMDKAHKTILLITSHYIMCMTQKIFT